MSPTKGWTASPYGAHVGEQRQFNAGKAPEFPEKTCFALQDAFAVQAIGDRPRGAIQTKRLLIDIHIDRSPDTFMVERA
jgi:hypothetical protein